MIHVIEKKIWIAVAKNEYKLHPTQATPICIVVTENNDEEYSLNVHLKETGMIAYSEKYKTLFAKRIDLSKLQTLDVKSFIQKYNK